MGKKYPKPRRPQVEISVPEMNRIVDSTRDGPLPSDDYTKLKTWVGALLAHQRPGFRSSEKTGKVVPPGENASETTDGSAATPGTSSPEGGEQAGPKEGKPRPPGHGRNGSSAFTGADKVEVKHDQLGPGDACTECPKGKVYPLKPKILLRFEGQAPIHGTSYELERLRCNLCGAIFTATPPGDVGTERYNETVSSAIAMLKYGSGIPFYRLESLQKRHGLPLPASTQWEIVEKAADLLEPIGDQLTREAAQADRVHDDDTSMRVLKLERPEEVDERTGVFTTGVVAVSDQGHKIAIFFTGWQYAGENLRDVLQHRDAELGPLIQMCDGLVSRNLPKGLKPEVEILLANCLPHARRKFVEVAENFPDECQHFLVTLGKVYKFDADTKDLGLDKHKRLSFHQEHSKPLMDGLEKWMADQLKQKKVEPNSGLGQAMRYCLKHWEPLTLFLRVAGAPLDNNICERALKKAVLHRKNALFYLTDNGARVGDLYMSLIHTCELNGINAFEYLCALQRHATDVARNPGLWMPWNYAAQLVAAHSG